MVLYGTGIIKIKYFAYNLISLEVWYGWLWQIFINMVQIISSHTNIILSKNPVFQNAP